MASQEEIDKILQLFHDVHPHHSWRQMDKASAGMGAVLRYLSMSDEMVTAGQLAAKLQISTARVAALLKKMEGKGLIIRETGPKDARTTVVRLSDYGWETVEELRTEIYGQINRLIDTIGMERLIEFTSIAKEITEVIEKPLKTILNSLLSGD